ncbi:MULTISPECIES: response regulator transcription factor [unclassified Marinobacterium]|uniref:response regulator transcription factor n=1 Tax=unclassified Marinobacterium TaxID=2644139 RepID=UPI001569FD81|nr:MULTISPECIES: response regulator transcription factor [unclassified Marinobacterium]NRP48017.1 Transcriptional regulatory protein DegU [Marinobacterium sp. xm-d-543]NRQ24256.1 Transcriptional regulatory protein DegU [Marinobacterium sp. xm-m-312]
MKSIFFGYRNGLRDNWKLAFPDAQVGSDSADSLQAKLVWLDISAFENHDAAPWVTSFLGNGRKVIVMSSSPNDEQAYSMMSIGASGYCHALAVETQLQEIADVVSKEGLWVGPGVLQRIMGIANKVASLRTGKPPVNPALSVLTAKELEVAADVAAGANNKEIAEKRYMSERTVKSHLTSIFQKLNVRDRVQLALLMNGVPFKTEQAS